MDPDNIDPNDRGGLAWHGHNDSFFSKGMEFLKKEYFHNKNANKNMKL